MSKDIILFEISEITFKEKFYRLMDLLVSKKSSSRIEGLIFLAIFYLQILAGFFDPHIGVLQQETSNSDNLLYQFYNIIRIKGLLKDNYSTFRTIIIQLFPNLILQCLQFFFLVKTQKKNATYTIRELYTNLIIKVFLFVLFNPILDLCLTTICFDTYNPNFQEVSCSLSNNSVIFLMAFFGYALTIFLAISLNLYYNDSYFLSNSYYSRMNCSYEVYMTLHCVFYSLFLTQAKYLGKQIFLVYNMIISVIFLRFYFDKYLFYNQVTNTLMGFFHIIYCWTSLFFLVFSVLEMNEKAIFYLIGWIIVIFLFFNLNYRLQKRILLKTPFHKITNKNHIMFYLKNLIDKIDNIEISYEDKAILVGIIELHSIECPSQDCITKQKNKRLFLPVNEEWSNRDKPEINDRVFLLNLVIVIMNYFIGHNYYNAEMLINLSFYYLNVIGNQCLAIYFFTKVKNMNLSAQDNFYLMRLKFAISKALVEKLKSANETNQKMTDVNFSYYYKYEDLCQQFFDEISNDVNLSLDFWKNFRIHQESGRQLDFTKIFYLTDKIRLTKDKIDKLWIDLYNTYSGVNDIFELYENYVELVNDDDLLKRDLETIRSKNINFSDNVTTNIYHLIFAKETGIVICNGDRGKEGIIEKMNSDSEKIFGYKADELKGVNVTQIMPKIFEKIHTSFLEKFYDVGEKRIIDGCHRTFAKDRDFCLLPIKLYVKVFPMLNNCVFHCALTTKEQLDDVILIDSKYNIQSITGKLVKRFEMENCNIFYEIDIPFYLICKKFIQFYKVYLKEKKNQKKRTTKKTFAKSSTIGDKLINVYKKSSSIMNNFSGKKFDLQDLEKIIPPSLKFAQDSFISEIGGPNNWNMSPTNNPLEEIPEEEESNEKTNELDINETVELELEIEIPMFMRDYMYSLKEKTKNKKLKKEGENISSKDKEKSRKLEDDEKSECDENEELVKNDNSTTGEAEQKEEDNFNKQSDEDTDFQMKIRHCRNLFDQGRLEELEDFIKNTNEERQVEEYKYNFTFEKYAFGSKGVAYIIKLIDNKMDYDGSQSNQSCNGNEIAKVQRQQSAKLEALRESTEILYEEKNDIIDRQYEYVKLCMEGGEFEANLSTFHKEIAFSSKIFGEKRPDNSAFMADENSSQCSGGGFNDNMAKKGRIEEIRSNIMNNVSSFFTIKWIKGIFITIILISSAFCGVYLMIFDKINTYLNDISNLNIGLYQTTIWTSNIISTLISLRSTYQFTLKNYPIKYNSYIADQTNYFKTLSKFTDNWYKNITLNFAPLEKQINLYFDTGPNSDLFWSQTSVTYSPTKISIQDTESVIMNLNQVLSNTNQLLKISYFSNNPFIRNSTKFTNHMKDFINYSTFVSIENSLDNLLPRLYKILNATPDFFSTQNNRNMKYVIYIILGYSFILFSMIFIYTLLLYLTNKNMEEGLEKVSKIKLDKIDETIKKIETFYKESLSKFRKKEPVTVIREETIEAKVDSAKKNNDSPKIVDIYDKIFSESQKFKKLKVLSFSYLQVIVVFFLCCSFLIPIYLVSLGMIDTSNQILLVQNHIFEKSLRASFSTVNVKCLISQCQTSNPQIYNIVTVDRTVIEGIIRDITDFPDLGYFYSNKYLLNACAVIWEQNVNNTNYYRCMSDLIVKSANNTESLLKLIDQTVSTIRKDEQMKSGQIYTLSNNLTVGFTNPLLFETENFRNLEYIFYNYIAPVSDAFAEVISVSFNDYLSSVKIKIVILISVFVFSILLFSFYIVFIFTHRLIHLLSVARVVLRIVPTTVISSTQELETWIESKY